MEIYLSQTVVEAADAIARQILDALKLKPHLVLGLATGSTPIEVYKRLAAACQRREASFARVRTFNLDEYLDLPGDHPQSYRCFMRRHLFDSIDIPPGNIHFPPSEGKNLVARCAEYEQRIVDAGGIDIQILGIGSNGHIGFNEPTSSLRSRTRIKTLTEKTLKDNSRFYGPGEAPPTLAVTMGIGTILDARKIVLQAFGARKAEAVRSAVEGPISSMVPGSALQLHPDVTFYLDPDAANLLKLKAYYATAQGYQKELEKAGRL
jgi:glucosamine-6-phosphate deaminase